MQHAEFWVHATTDESSDEQQVFVFDTRQLSEQIEALCGCFGLQFDQDDEYRMLTSGPSVDTRPLRSIAEVLILPQNTQLGLHLGSEVVEARIHALANAAQGNVLEPLRKLFFAIRGDHWMCGEFVDKGGMGALLESVLGICHGDHSWAEAVELAMVCLSVLITLCNEARDWLAEHLDELRAPFFARLFAALFPPLADEDLDGLQEGSSAVSETPPRASLTICLFLLQAFPSCAEAAAEAASIGASKWGTKASGGFGPAYPRIFAAMREEEGRDEFQVSASLALLCALVGAAADNDELRPQVRNDFANFTSNEELEELFAPECREQHLREMQLSFAMDCCSELAVGQQEDLLQEVAQLKSKTQIQQETIERLQVELQQRHRACCAMVPFMKVDSSLLVEQSLDSLVRFGWESISWRNNYTLLHFAADCLEDPNIIELVGSFARDVDQRDDSGKRPIDYARKNACPEVAPTLERLRKQQRQDSSWKLAACVSAPTAEDQKVLDRGTADALRDRLRCLEGISADLREGIEAVLRLGPQGVPWLSGYSALHLAAHLGHVDATDLLLRARADVSEVDNWHMTALDYAEQNQHAEVRQALQAAGASRGPLQSPSTSGVAAPDGRKASDLGLRHRMLTEEVLDLTNSRRNLCPADDDEASQAGSSVPSLRNACSMPRLSAVSGVSRLSLISDADLGLSDEQLADIGDAFSRSSVRHRALTSSTDDDALSVHSSAYGLSEWQLLELHNQEGHQPARHRLNTAMTDVTTASARDSEYGFSDSQLEELRRRHATMCSEPGVPLLRDDEQESNASETGNIWENLDPDDGPVRVQTSGLSAQALQQLPGAEPEEQVLNGQRLQRRLTETSERRFSSVTDSDFGLSDAQLASLAGAQWSWETEARPTERIDQDDMPCRSTENDSSVRVPRAPACKPESVKARPSLRKRVSFRADCIDIAEEPTSEQNSVGATSADDAPAAGTPSSLAQQLEVTLAAMFKDGPSASSDEAVAVGSGAGDAVADAEMEPSCRQACRLVTQRGWGNVSWQNSFTALHLAAHHRDVAAVRFLLQARASSAGRLQDSSGMSPMDYARRAGGEGELLEILQAADSHPAVSSTAVALRCLNAQTAESQAAVGSPAGRRSRAGSVSEPQSPVSLGDAVTERFNAPRTRDPATPMDAAELHARLIRVEKERAALLEERNRPLLQGGSSLAHAGHLDEHAMRKLLEQLQAFGRDNVLGKVQEPRMSGGLALSAADATSLVEQLEVVLRVSQTMHEPAKARRRSKRLSSRRSTWTGGENDLAAILGLVNGAEEQDEEAARKSLIEEVQREQIRASWGVAVKEAAAIASSSFVGAARQSSQEESESEESAESGPEQAASICRPRPAEIETEPRQEEVAPEALAPTLKGKGKGKSKAPATPKGKGKGKSKEEGSADSKKLQPSKPKVDPEVKMKPLWWVRYLKGVHLKEGETVWDLVTDETGMLPVDVLNQRFGKAHIVAKSAPETSRQCNEQEQQQPSILRVITDPALIAGREAALKYLPTPQDVAAAIIELDEQALPVDKLQNVISNACPTPLQVEQLGKAREERPTARFASPEQYMWAIMQIPAYKARLDCWSFVRTYTERRLQCVEALRRFEEITDCFQRARNLPLLLGLILAVGNYLNGGTERGQADGFDIETLSKLDSVKDGDGRDLRHLIFETFFNKCPEKACEVVEELCPLLANVTRTLVRDADGVERLSKKVNVTIEDYDFMTNALQDELDECLSSAEMILQYIDDPADRFKLRMPEQIARAKEQIGALSKMRDRAKEKFSQLMHWFKISPTSGLKSSDFCLLWDELFIPEALIVRRPARVKSGHLIPSFCGQGKRITGEQLMVLWGVREPSAQKRPAAKAGLKGGRRDRKRGSLTQQTEKRKSLRFQVGALMAAQRSSRKKPLHKAETRERFFTASADQWQDAECFQDDKDADLEKPVHANTFCG